MKMKQTSKQINKWQRLLKEVKIKIVALKLIRFERLISRTTISKFIVRSEVPEAYLVQCKEYLIKLFSKKVIDQSS